MKDALQHISRHRTHRQSSTRRAISFEISAQETRRHTLRSREETLGHLDHAGRAASSQLLEKTTDVDTRDIEHRTSPSNPVGRLLAEQTSDRVGEVTDQIIFVPAESQD
jgi:hypothetical protein